MKLSAKLICYHLQKSFSMHTSRLDTSPTLSCPSCFEKNTVLQDGRVYLITDPETGIHQGLIPLIIEDKNILNPVKDNIDWNIFRDDTHVWLS